MEDNKPARRLTPHGAEELDPTPLAVPVKFRRPETLAASVQRLVAGEVSRMADAMGYESFDDADDFDVEDIDFVPGTRYELDDGQVQYDMRRDDRYKKVEELENVVAGNETGSDGQRSSVGGGTAKGKQKVQRSGKGKDENKEPVGSGKGSVNRDDEGGAEA